MWLKEDSDRGKYTRGELPAAASATRQWIEDVRSGSAYAPLKMQASVRLVGFTASESEAIARYSGRGMVVLCRQPLAGRLRG